MRYFKSILVLTITVFFMSASTDTEELSGLPSYSLKKMTGESIDLSDYGKNNRPTIISFWATWCKPCINELNAMADYYADWQEDYNVEIVAVSLDNQRTVGRVGSVVNSNSWEYDVLLDVNGDSYRKFNFQNPPYLILVNKEGKIYYKHSGYTPGSEDEVEEKLMELAE